MSELVLVANPSHRKRSKGKHRRRRGPRKGVEPAGLRRWRLAHKHGGHKRRRKSSHHKHRRHTAHATHHVKRRGRGNPHRRHHVKHHRRRSNPTLRGFTGAIMPTVKAGAWGAAGALGLDALWGLLYPRLGTFSTYLDNPYIGFFAKAVGAVTVGKFGGRIARGRGTQMAHGAMTVVAHDFFKSLLTQLAPTIFGAGGAVPLGAYLSGSAPIVGTATIPQAYLPFSGVVPQQFGAYMSGSSGQSGGDNGMYNEDRTGLDPWNG